MKKQIMSSVVATLLLAGAGLASAAEPVALTDSQMDAVSAGTTQVSWSTAGASALVGLATAGTSTGAFSSHHFRVTRASGAALAVGIGASAGSSSGSIIF